MLYDIKIMFRIAGVLFKGSSYSKGSANGLKKNSNKWVYPVICLCMIPMLASMVMLIVGAYGTLEQAGKADLIIKTYLVLSVVLTLFMGFFYALSILFFANDNELLCHLPVKSWQICGARFINILFYEYLYEAFVYIPFVITFGIMARAGVLFYIYSIILGAMLPILPVALISILAMLIMRFVPFFKNRDRINLFSTLAVFVFMFAVYMPMMNKLEVEDDENISALFEMIAGENSSVVKIFGYVIPSMLCTFKALDGYSSIYGFLWFAAAMFISLAGFALFMLAANLIYEKASNGIGGVTAKHRKLSDAEFSANSEKSSALKALVKKEIKLLIRTPVFFVNCCLMTWIWPVFFCVGFSFSADWDAFFEAREYIEQNIDAFLPYVLAGVVMITAFISSTSASASTAISRDGSAVIFAKIMPVPYYTQLKAKLYASFLLCGIPGAIVMGIVASVMNCGLFNSILIMFVAGTASVYVSGVGLLVDMGRPKLVWTDENAAVKQNVNSLISFALSIPVGIAVCILPMLISLYNTFLGGIAFAVMSIFAIWAVLTVIKMRADKCYDNIQM